MIQWKINFDKRNKTFYTKSLPWQKSWCKWIESLSLFHDSPLTFCFLWFFFSFRLMFIWLSCLSSWWNTLKYNQQMAAREAERTVTHTASSSILQASTALQGSKLPCRSPGTAGHHCSLGSKLLCRPPGTAGHWSQSGESRHNNTTAALYLHLQAADMKLKMERIRNLVWTTILRFSIEFSWIYLLANDDMYDNGWKK